MNATKGLVSLAVALAGVLNGLAEAVEFDGTEPWPTGGDVVLTKSVVVDDAHVAAVAGWENLTINSGVRLTFANASAEATLNANCSGGGTIAALDSCKLVIAGDNRNFNVWNTSQMQFTNSNVLVTHEYGLCCGKGSTWATFYFTKTGTLGALNFDNGEVAFTNHCPIYFMCDNAYTAGGDKMTIGSIAPEKYFVQDADFRSQPGGANRYLRFKNNYRQISGYFGNTYAGSMLSITSASTPSLSVYFDGTTKLNRGEETGSYRMDSLAVYGLQLHLANTGGFTGSTFDQDTGTLYFDNSEALADPVEGKRTNVRNITLAVNAQLQTTYKSRGELNADTTIHRFLNFNYSSPESGTRYWPLHADEPATLTLGGDGAGANYAPVPVQLTGQASLFVNNNATNAICTKVSAPDGTLTIENAALRLVAGTGSGTDAGWDGTGTVIRDGGVLICESPASLTGGRSALEIEEGGKLVFADGCAGAVFNRATIGGVELDIGSYTFAELRDEYGLGDYVEGADASVVTVDIPGGEWTGWPDEEDGVATVPKGAQVTISDDDVPKVAKLSAIRMGSGATVTCSPTVALAIKARISGTGTFRIVDAANVVLLGDNSKLASPGSFYIENSAVAVSNRFGLGSARTGAANVKFVSADRKLVFGLADSKHFTNEVALVCNQTGAASIASIGPEAEDEYFVQAADFTCASFAQYEKRLVFRGNVEFSAGTFSISGGLYAYGSIHAKVKFGSGCSVVNSAKTPATIAFYGAGYNVGMDAIPVFDFGPQSAAGIVGVVREMCVLKFSNADIFTGETKPSVSYTTSATAQAAHGVIDFCGCDQALNAFSIHYSSSKVTKGNKQIAPLVSEAPATVTLLTTDAGLVRDQVSFEGALGYRYAGAGTNLLCNLKSTSTGGFRVSSGVAGFDWGAAWGGTNIVVDGTGTLYISADSAPAFGTKAVAKTSGVTLTLKDSGKLYLEGGETFVGWAIRDGEDIPRGTYTAVNCDWIEGEGSLRVLHDHAGIVLIVR